MTNRHRRGLLGEIDRLLKGEATLNGLDDAGLLELFALRRDEAAFEIMIRRHGPMVLGVCRRFLSRSEDVEDAFQATFLILSRKAQGLGEGGKLASWLFSVARKVSSRAAKRMSRRPEPIGDRDFAVVSANDDALLAKESKAVLDDELARLPAKFRDPLILCYLEGLTHEQAAVRLRCPVGTVRSRMAGGRSKLRERLIRKGLAIPAGLAVIGLDAAGASAMAVPPELVAATVRHALTFSLGAVRSAATALIPGSLTTLTREALSAMFLTKLAWCAGAGTLTLGLFAAGAGGYVASQRQRDDSGAGVAQAEAKAAASEQAALREEAERLRGQVEVLTKKLSELEIKLAGSQAGEPPDANDVGDKPGGAPTKGAQAQRNRAGARTKGMAGGGPGAQGGMAGAMGGGMGPGRGARGGGMGAMRGGMGPGMAIAGGMGGMGGGMMGRMGPGMGGMNGMMGGGMGAGMGGGFLGGADAAENAQVQEVGGIFVINTPEHKKITLFNAETGERLIYKAPEGATVSATPSGFSDVLLECSGKNLREFAVYSAKAGKILREPLVKPASGTQGAVVGNQVIGMTMEGGPIAQLTVFSVETGTFYTHKLKVPFEGAVAPMCAGPVTLYAIGNTFYAFSRVAEQWDILELPKDSGPPVPIIYNDKVTIATPKHVYIFRASSKKWLDINLEDDDARDEK